MTDFNIEIKEIEQRLESTMKSMEDIRQQILAAAGTFFTSWYMATTESHVRRDPTLTQKLGTEKLSQLKKEIKDLQMDTPKFVKEILGDDSVWWASKAK